MTAVFGALDVGSAVGLLVCGPLIHAFGWPSVFYLFAALGLVWSALWPLLKPDQADSSVPPPPPSSSPSVSGASLVEGPSKVVADAHACLRLAFPSSLTLSPVMACVPIASPLTSTNALTCKQLV